MQLSIERRITFGLAIALAILVINALVSYRAARRLIDNDHWVSHTHEVIAQLETTLSTITDAETGERGYLLTGDDSYLAPYNAALSQIGADLNHLKDLTADNLDQRTLVASLEEQISNKISALRQTIDLRKTQGFQAALRLVSTGRGNVTMNAIRVTIDAMESKEADLLIERRIEAAVARRDATLTFSIATLVACGLLVILYLVIIRDVTARRRAEEALGREREWLRITLTSIGDAVIATDVNGVVTFLNPVAESLVGWSRQDAEGQQLDQVFKIVNEDTRLAVENPAFRAIKDGRVVGAANHAILIARNGTEIPIDDSGAPISNADGETIGVILVFRDVTERKKAEALQVEQSRLLDLSHDAIMVRSANGDISFWNRRAEQMYGWRADEAIGQVSHTLLHTMFPRSLAEIKAELNRQGWWEGTLIHTRKDGTPVVVASRWALRREPLWEDGVILEMNSDITGQKRIEEERSRLLASERAARERAESASRAKDEFVAMISHELRAPLNSILGWTQLLGTGKLDQPETARAVEAIERGAKAQVQLIGDLLDVSRAITGKLVLSPRVVELREVVESAVESISPAADAKSIRLNVHFDPRGGCVFGDPGRLHQIAWNLLSNAVKFTPRSGSIDVRIERSEPDLQIAVSDSGAGINPEFLPYVFDRFSQAKTSADRKYGGLGLGLAIVKHLVELHGGTVQAYSAGEGKGATFTVTLPIYAVHEQALELHRPGLDTPSGTSSTSIKLDGLRIVIVDDDADAREMLSSMLVQAGAEVKACQSARDALEAIEQWRPFALVSDIGMPDEDGYFLIRELRAREPERGGDIPAIALTGYARSEDRTRALAAGFQTHVPKPVESAELIMVIASLAGRTGKASREFRAETSNRL
jgi:PAS domain S-box-containing protein